MIVNVHISYSYLFLFHMYVAKAVISPVHSSANEPLYIASYLHNSVTRFGKTDRNGTTTLSILLPCL